MRREAKTFIKKIDSLEYPKVDKSGLATRIIYNGYLTSFGNRVKKEKDNQYFNSLLADPKIKDTYDTIAYSYFSKKEFKELSSSCVSKFQSGAFISFELYKLVVKLLKIKNTDILFHVNAPDETFLLEASNSTKTSPLKLSTYVIPDNDYASELIEMRLELNEVNYSLVDDIEKINKFKPTKIFISSIYNTLDKEYKYSIRKNRLWDDLLEITKLMQNDSRVVVLIPNVMLSNSSEKEKKEQILVSGFLEGIISLPLRYYSKLLKTDVSLLILSKGNKNVKIADIDNVFNHSDVKLAKLEHITDYIIDSYNTNFVEVDKEVLIAKGSNLLISNIITDSVYEGMGDLTQLSTIADVKKGMKQTKIDFQDVIDQNNQSPYCLLNSIDIEDGAIDYEGLTRIIYDQKYERYVIKNGDVVITNKSSKVKIAVIECEDKKIIPTGSMIIITPHENELDGTYLKMFFESDKGKELISKVQRGQKTNTLYPKDIEQLLLPQIDYEAQLKRVNKYKKQLSEYYKKKGELEEVKKDLELIINEGDKQYVNE